MHQSVEHFLPLYELPAVLESACETLPEVTLNLDNFNIMVSVLLEDRFFVDHHSFGIARLDQC